MTNLKPIFLLTLICSTIFISSAQDAITNTQTKVTQWRLSKFGVDLGVNNDVFKGTSREMLVNQAATSEIFTPNIGNLEEAIYTRVVGVHAGFTLSYIPHNLGTNRLDLTRELRIGVDLHFGREALVSYCGERSVEYDLTLYNMVSYCNIDNEISLKADYLIKTQPVYGIQLFSGLGANLGTSVGKRVLVFGDSFLLSYDIEGNEIYISDDEMTRLEQKYNSSYMYEYRSKPTIFSRLYIPAGISFNPIDRIELVGEGRLGVGMMSMIGGENHFITTTFSISGGVNIRF